MQYYNFTRSSVDRYQFLVEEDGVTPIPAILRVTSYKQDPFVSSDGWSKSVDFSEQTGKW